MSFGSYLREKRKSKGMNQRVLAMLIGVDISYICKIESDKLPSPSEECIMKICENLKLDTDETMFKAGRIPSDITDILFQSPQCFKMIRDMLKSKKEVG